MIQEGWAGECGVVAGSRDGGVGIAVDEWCTRAWMLDIDLFSGILTCAGNLAVWRQRHPVLFT